LLLPRCAGSAICVVATVVVRMYEALLRKVPRRDLEVGTYSTDARYSSAAGWLVDFVDLHALVDG